jgi:hypothetical protein
VSVDPPIWDPKQKFDKATGDRLLFDRLKYQALTACYGRLNPFDNDEVVG